MLGPNVVFGVEDELGKRCVIPRGPCGGGESFGIPVGVLPSTSLGLP